MEEQGCNICYCCLRAIKSKDMENDWEHKRDFVIQQQNGESEVTQLPEGKDQGEIQSAEMCQNCQHTICSQCVNWCSACNSKNCKLCITS